ncbi:alpha/beta fold hydrolase [Halioglobus maricola]|uniref:alpha/beta fold hydrolase n=1 Tax=Halioglobus maricola TaxID=2601894 RepID=UPI001479326E|nr:alpha/beta hydrolase [Halioglobus maricola]
MSAVRRAYADVGGRQVHYRVAGERGAPVLVLFHQSPSTSAMYQSIMEKLTGRFYLLAPDSPGFGGSDPLEGGDSIPAYAGHLSAWLDGMKVSSCGFFGHHTGAAVATELASQRPDLCSALALSGPTLLTDEQRAVLPGSVAGVPADADGNHLLELWQRLRAKDPRVPLALSQREMLSALHCGEHYRGSYQAVCDHDYEACLDALHCPVLAFAGEDDALLSAVEPTLARLQCGETRAPIAAARTYVCESHAEEVATILADFFGAARNEE